MDVEDTAGVRIFEPGDVVKVRTEAWPSLVLPPIQPARKRHRVLWWLNRKTGEGLDLPSTCCVPIVLVRTPADDENGRRRWVEIRDLTLLTPD